MITIEHNVEQAASKLEQIGKQLNANLDAVVYDIVTKYTEEVRRNIETQGRRFGSPWEPPSKWIAAKKGEGHKILEGADRFLTVLGGGLESRVAFISPGPWTLTQHHDGFVVPADGQEYTIRLVNPFALGLEAGHANFKFAWKKNSVVPPRKIWPTENEVVQMIHPLIEDFAKKTEQGVGH